MFLKNSIYLKYKSFFNIINDFILIFDHFNAPLLNKTVVYILTVVYLEIFKTS